MRSIIILLVVASCGVEPIDKGTQAGIADDPSGCPSGQHVGWGDNETTICVANPVWPPTSVGSRVASSTCPIANGEYAIAWHTDIVENGQPAFSVTRVATVFDDLIQLGEWPFALAWDDAGHAYAWEPGLTDIHEFRVVSDCADGISGWVTVELPYVNPGRQVETWWFEPRR